MFKYLISMTSALVAAPLVAQPTSEGAAEETLPDPVAAVPEAAITVVATGLALRRADDGYPVAIIDEAELRQVQGPDIARTLRRLPGVIITRNGGLGGFTGVRVRGGGAEQLLVLIDGVKVNDVSSPGGGFDFGNLAAEEIGKVELLRGAHSVVWGSDALAGVMNLSTRSVDGLAASAEYGGAGQLSGHAVAGVDGTGAAASLAGGFVRARGISSAAAGTERDGFRQWHVSARGRARIADGWQAIAAGRMARGALEIDGFPPPQFAFADTRERQDTRERSGSAGVEHESDRLKLRANLAHSANDRDLLDETAGGAPYYETRGRLTRAELFGRLALGGALDAVRVDFGADREWSRFAADGAFSADRGSARTASGHALLTFDGGDVSLGAGARYDRHSRFGGEWSLGANGVARLGSGVALRASYGEGFKAPTLFQLLSDFGNAALVPERSRSYDLGLSFDRRAFSAGVSLFRRDSRDLIDFVSCFGAAGGICTGRPFGTYDNVGRARAEGFEVEASWRIEGRRAGEWPLQFRTAYSYVKATNALSGADLARRPRHALSVAGDWTIEPGRVFSTTVGADLRLVSDSFDDAANRTRLDGYALVDLRASRPLLLLDAAGQRTVDLFARIENAFDARYSEVAGYGTQGRAGYIGLRVGL